MRAEGGWQIGEDASVHDAVNWKKIPAGEEWVRWISRARVWCVFHKCFWAGRHAPQGLKPVVCQALPKTDEFARPPGKGVRGYVGMARVSGAEFFRKL